MSVARAKADVLGAVRLLREARPDLPVGLVGHSMGACFALHALVEDPDVRAAVLCAPMATVRAEMATLEFGGYRALGRVSALAARVGLGHLSVPYKYSEKHLFRDPEAARRAKEAGFLTRKVSFANYDDLLAMDATLPASEARRPVLVILAQHDRAVKHASSRAVYDALVGPKELVTVPTGHSMFGDRDGALAVREVDRWMRRHLAKGSA